MASDVHRLEESARLPAFVVQIKPDHEDQEDQEDHKADEYTFACDSDDEYHQWMTAIHQAQEQGVQTVQLGEDFMTEVRSLRDAAKKVILMNRLISPATTPR